MKKIFMFLGLTATGLALVKKISNKYDIEIKITKKNPKRTPQEGEEIKQEEEKDSPLEDEKEIEVTIEEE